MQTTEDFACYVTIGPEQIYIPPGLSDDTPVCLVSKNYARALTRTCIRLGWIREMAKSHTEGAIDAN